MEWTRAALEARVDKLAEDHDGEELVTAVSAFADQLGDDDRRLLGRILLERAPRRGRIPDYPRWSVILPRARRRRAR